MTWQYGRQYTKPCMSIIGGSGLSFTDSKNPQNMKYVNFLCRFQLVEWPRLCCDIAHIYDLNKHCIHLMKIPICSEGETNRKLSTDDFIWVGTIWWDKFRGFSFPTHYAVVVVSARADKTFISWAFCNHGTTPTGRPQSKSSPSEFKGRGPMKTSY